MKDQIRSYVPLRGTDGLTKMLGWGIYNRQNKKICIYLREVIAGSHFSCKEKHI